MLVLLAAIGATEWLHMNIGYHLAQGFAQPLLNVLRDVALVGAIYIDQGYDD